MIYEMLPVNSHACHQQCRHYFSIKRHQNKKNNLSRFLRFICSKEFDQQASYRRQTFIGPGCKSRLPFDSCTKRDCSGGCNIDFDHHSALNQSKRARRRSICGSFNSSQKRFLYGNEEHNRKTVL
jgi:hypothetical protein